MSLTIGITLNNETTYTQLNLTKINRLILSKSNTVANTYYLKCYPSNDSNTFESITITTPTSAVCLNGLSPFRKDLVLLNFINLDCVYYVDINTDVAFNCELIKNYNTSTLQAITYFNASEKNRLDKSKYLIEDYTYNITLKEETSVETPTIILNFTGNINKNPLPQFNYVYIPALKRYYFVNEIKNISLNMWEINLNVDVLMTYKDSILNQHALIERQENIYNKYLKDSETILSNKTSFTYIPVLNTVFDISYMTLADYNIILSYII